MELSVRSVDLETLNKYTRHTWFLVSARLAAYDSYNRSLMRHASAALLIFLAFVSRVLSFDITTLNGNVYHDAHVTAVDPDGLHITHRFGVAKIPFEELPESLRAQYHYDKQKADAYRQQLAARQRSTAGRPAANPRPAATQGRMQAYSPNRAGQSPLPGISSPTRAQRILAIIVSSGIALLILGLALAVYFLPTLVGLRKQNAGGIFLLNLLLGWTLAGWIAAFVWAFKADARISASERAYR
jgi:Superinfection immunity protein